MRHLKLLVFTVLVCAFLSKLNGQTENITLLEAKLSAEIENSTNEFYILHCQSIIDVVNAHSSGSANADAHAEQIYEQFISENTELSAARLENYLSRGWAFIIAWTSEQDGETSFTWLRLPKDWNPDKEYPMYVQLHGLWDVAANPMEYMAYPFRSQSSSYAFEDGYHLSPWGRGNHWYQGVSEEDIWECIAYVKNNFKVDLKRQYLCGHSMGGYGAWHIAHQSANNWAAIGLHAAAIWWNTREVTALEAGYLWNVPSYFVCGTNDGNIRTMQDAYNLLQAAGNTNLEFATFTGGHEYRGEDVEAMYNWMRHFENTDFVSPITKSEAPNELWLSTYPTHVHDMLNVDYYVDKQSTVTIELYNCVGEQVQHILNKEQAAGLYSEQYSMQEFQPGLYFLILKTESQTKVSRFTIVP